MSRALLALLLLVGACTTARPAGSPASSDLPAPTIDTVATSTTIPAPSTTQAVAATTTIPSTTTTVPPAPLQALALELVADLRRPVAIATAPGDDRVFVAEQGGVIRVVEGSGNLAEEPFLDITDRVFAGGIEQGLLGLAFHPSFASNGRLFVYYTDASNDTHLVEFRAPAGGVADRATAREVLTIAQPTDRHNGGMLLFGPDGYLWLGLGEGGAARDNAQNPSTLLGSILRIDVDGGDPYGIVGDNPFVAGGGAPEVWAYGLRNPWRFTIDPVDRLLYIGDVGHSEWEEINVVSIDTDAGANFGWLPMEGTRCFLAGCDPTGMTLPVVEYEHIDSCSVTGGVVYRGDAIPELHGVYVYGDWCGGWAKSFRIEDGNPADAGVWFDDLGR
ncbi:MAG: PQQ-dependent sugar dehydrogenase, partial [Acidimicrobiia bacterium]|nr:PQQ-dependent sugar dehydrogenase [Acidimicrobiia bacterium]